MRILSAVLAAALLTFSLIGCGGIAEEKDKKITIYEGSDAQCKRIWLDVEYLEDIRDTQTAPEARQACEEFKARHLGAHCQRKVTRVDSRGNKTVETEDIFVDNSINCNDIQ